MFNRNREVPNPALTDERTAIQVGYGRRVSTVQVIARPDGSEYIEVVLEQTPPAPDTVVHYGIVQR